MRSLESLVSNLALIASLGIIAPWILIVYLAFRHRALQEGQWDRDVGLKAAGHLLLSLGLFVALGAATALAIELVVETPPRPSGEGLSESMRVAFGFLISGCALAGVVALSLAIWSNDQQYPMVRRFFVGVRFGVSSLVAFGAFTVALVALFLKDPIGNQFKVAAAVFGVWTASAVVHFIRLLRTVGQNNIPAADLDVVPPRGAAPAGRS